MSLYRMVFLGLLGLGVIPVAILTAAYLPGVLSRMETEAHRYALAESEGRLELVEQRLNTMRQTVQELSILPVYPELLGTGSVEKIHVLKPDVAANRFTAVMNRWFDGVEDVIAITVIDTNGQERLRMERLREDMEFHIVPRNELRDRRLAPCFRRGIDSDPQQVHIGVISPSLINACFRKMENLYLPVSKLIRSTGGTPIGVLVVSVDLVAVISNSPDNVWILEDGSYLNRPADVAVGGGTNALTDFPELADLLSAKKTAIVHGAGSGQTWVWSPLVLDQDHQELLWVANAVDESSVTQALKRFLWLALSITLALAALVFLLARRIAARTEALKDRIIDTVESIIRGENTAGFAWQGPAEIRTLGHELEQLATSHRQLESERNNVEAQLAAEKERVVTLNKTLEQRVAERTHELALANRELKAFSYSVSHDLRAPLRAINGFVEILLEDHAATLNEEALECAQRIRHSGWRMSELIDDLLALSMASRQELRYEPVDLSAVVREIVATLREHEPDRAVKLTIQDGVATDGDRQLLKIALQNLLSNAWKYTGRTADAHIEFGCDDVDGQRHFYVRDNGAGFDMAQADRLFTPFARLHEAHEYEGTGVGLATVQRIVERHAGRIRAQGESGKGATFYFTLGTENLS